MSSAARLPITFASTLSAALQGAEHLLVLAPKERFSARRLPRVLEEPLRSAALRAAKDTNPGDLGAVATTLVEGSRCARLTVGVLPDEVARYNSAARAESVRRATAAAGLQRAGSAAVLLVLDDARHLVAASNAVGRALPLYSAKTGAATKRGTRIKLCAVTRSGQPVPATAFAREVLAANREAARLVDTPPTEMAPAALAREARKLLAKIPHVRVTEIAGDKLLQNGLGGIHAVGRTALSPPRLLVATYAPPGAKGDAIALVGKGITYDTGGLHVKMRGMMEGMKCDMGGAAAVLGAFRVIARTKVKKKVHLLLCLAENAIGPSAYKPDDILTMHSGKTVEINNTDAEGRVVLADGVSWAARKLKAGVILDAATLTGAQMVATGVVHAAVVSNDERIEQAVVAAGRDSGDLVHPLMFAPELYRQELRSPVADMRNSVKNRGNAQVSCAAEFIHWHIADAGVRWAHVDLAGPAWRGDRGTGFGVALLATAVRDL